MNMASPPLPEVVARKRGLIFDLFHTLTCIEFTSEGLPTAEMLGVDREAWRAEVRAARWRLLGVERDPYAIIRRLALAVDPALPEVVIRRAYEARLERFAQALLNPPEVSLRVLRRLKAAGKTLGLISDADPAEVAAWSRSPLAGLFDCAVMSCEVGLTKPDARIYALCLDKLGLGAQECLYVGNGGSQELAGARAVGLGTVMMAGIARRIWPDRALEGESDADYVVDSLEELLLHPSGACSCLAARL
jgi:putative hydrolase of the HAD superfamily